MENNNLLLEQEILDRVRESDDKLFRDKIEMEIRQDVKNKVRKHKLVVMITTITSLAAILLIGILVLRPIQKLRINNYMSEVTETVDMPVLQIGLAVRGDDSVTTAMLTKTVSIVNNTKLEHQFFVKNGIVCISIKDKSSRFFMHVNEEGIPDLYCLTPTGDVYLLDLTLENSIREFEKVTDMEIINAIRINAPAPGQFFK